MADYVLEAELRERTGKGEARRLRRAGKLPAIIYGGGKPDLPIALDFAETVKKFDEEHFHTSLIEIKVKGKRTKNTVLLKDAQYDPILDWPVHVDFHRVSSKDRVHIEVPVHPINHEKCPGVVAGGLVDLVRHALEVTCRADAIPEFIEIDCADMDIGDTVHIDDIALPEGVEVQHDVNFTVLNIGAPTKATAAEEAEEETEAEEGAAEE